MDGITMKRQAGLNNLERCRQIIWAPHFPVNVSNNLSFLVGVSLWNRTTDRHNIPREEGGRQLDMAPFCKEHNPGRKRRGDLPKAHSTAWPAPAEPASLMQSGGPFTFFWAQVAAPERAIVPWDVITYSLFRELLKFNSVTIRHWEIMNWEWTG